MYVDDFSDWGINLGVSKVDADGTKWMEIELLELAKPIR